jgi:hypothetical protein
MPDLLRHTVATLAYRGGKAVRGVPEAVGNHRVGPDARTPLEILAHINDLLDWARHLCDGRRVFNVSVPGSWAAESLRFHTALAVLDARLASSDPLGCPAEKLFQGPIADALTHVGQIALIRRAAGAPQRGENYYVAEIAAGRLGADQATAVSEFD